MKEFLEVNEWSIIEQDFHQEYNKVSESIFSLGNGRFGQRANFEEDYSGETMLGNYVAGVYYPDKTRVGWWKNGYPEYFAKVLNAANWTGIRINIDGENLDLHKCVIKVFRRELNMHEGYLRRSFTATTALGKEVKVDTVRFCSIADDSVAAIRYSLTPVNFSGKVSFTAYIDGDVKNQDSNYDEVFWNEVNRQASVGSMYITMKTKKTGFDVCTGSVVKFTQAGNTLSNFVANEDTKWVANEIAVDAKMGEELVLEKFVSIISSMNHVSEKLVCVCENEMQQAAKKGFEILKLEQKNAWAHKWEGSDIVIEGDAKAQQGIRFNIFQLNQTYTGEDERLNIGPKGFTGEKYGGSSYWDTEAYCVPFYLATADARVARNLLLYRYKHLDRAIENAEKLGFKNGAALYPMVTMNGEECHNEWEITFEEIHRNGAMSYAIQNYVNYTDDKQYLVDYGLEVLIAIARFWSQRINWSVDRKQYVMLGVTGPNEYENNVNNNWYTNYLACWCMRYANEVIEYVKQADAGKYATLVNKIKFDEKSEVERWKDICNNMYLPESKELGIYLQQDGYLDKEQILVKDMPASELPLNQKWSWDRILRSCFIKQADVLQGMYFFEDDFDIDSLRRNFDFYEPRTVHESSLSPCVHAIIASKLGDEERAYNFYLRTSRLDLDDYNNDTEDGCHTTSMAGTWMSVVHGFAGMRVRKGELYFDPFLPQKWQSFSFKIVFKNALLTVNVNKSGVKITNTGNSSCKLYVYGKEYTIASNSTIEAVK